MSSNEDNPTVHLLLAIFTRELKTAFFLALSDEPNIHIVATAANTAELLTYNRSLQPNAIVLEWELPGRPMSEAYSALNQAEDPPSIFIVGKPSSERHIRELAPECDLYADPEKLIHELKVQ